MKKTLIATSLILSLNAFSVANVHAAEKTKEESKKELIGFGSGALAGGAIGGPIGAVLGGIFGILIADDVNDEDKKLAQLEALNATEYALSQRDNEIIALQGDIEKLHHAKKQQYAKLKAAQSAEVLEAIPNIETNIQFRTASFVIENEYESQLNTLANLLKQYPDLRVSVNGFADQRGDSKYNKVLSEQRANAIADYLNAKGVETSQIDYSGFGETQTQLSASATPSAEEYFFDRRATLKIIPSQQNMTAAK